MLLTCLDDVQNFFLDCDCPECEKLQYTTVVFFETLKQFPTCANSLSVQYRDHARYYTCDCVTHDTSLVITNEFEYYVDVVDKFTQEHTVVTA